MQNSIYTALVLLLFFQLNAQEVLTKSQAIEQTLENNFGITIAKNFETIAKNNSSLLNAGFFPSLTGIAGMDYSIQDQDATFQNGNTQRVEDAETKRYNASLNVNFLLFDGLGRHYNYKRLKELYNLSELEVRETIEITALQLFSVYFEVARLTENATVLENILLTTKERLNRAQIQFEYGQNTGLEVLNAQVDVTTDSINLLNVNQQLKNAKRDLNFVLNRELDINYQVDTLVDFLSSLQIENFIATAEKENVHVLQSEKNIKISDYEFKSGRGLFLPTVGLTGNYGWNEGNFPATNFLASNTSVGFNAGINLSWNLFDGGRALIAYKNAKINIEIQSYQREMILFQLRRDIANAKGILENKLAIFRLQDQNVLTTQSNYDRSYERYKMGQISSLELRQAQINLLNAKTNKNGAKYEAKLAELQLLQLTGKLLEELF